jgi:hypothetical protein
MTEFWTMSLCGRLQIRVSCALLRTIDPASFSISAIFQSGTSPAELTVSQSEKSVQVLVLKTQMRNISRNYTKKI